MKLQQARKVMLALFAAMALSLLLGAILSGTGLVWASLFFVILGTILFFAFIAYTFSHWRCPHCGEYLGRVGKGIQLCPYCHERLDK